MPATRTVTHKATRKAMTLVELEAAIADARRSGAHDGTVPTVRIVFGGGIKQITFVSSADADAVAHEPEDRR